ncbi:MAG: Ger(x)C family spore germination protein, partial [Actinobacteria bacterium]|nr:Ger(x)C family spore germination protein [Actinomycetota bacterium]
MRNRVCIVFLLIIILTQLAGCFDAHEINDFTYVTMFGIDKGISDKWRLTVQFRTVSQNSTSGQGDGGSGSNQGGFNYQTETIDAPSFFAAVNLINSNIPRQLNFEHCKLIVLSDELAKSGLVGEFIAPLTRFRQIRRTTDMAVIEGNAEDFIETFKPFIGDTITLTIEDLFGESKKTAFFPAYDLDKFYEDLKTSYGQPVLALGAINDSRNFITEGQKWDDEFNIAGDYYAGETPRKNGNKIELLGCAIFNGDTMVGKLTGNESRLRSIITGDFQKAIFTIQDPKASKFVVPLETWQSSKPEIIIRFKNGKPFINLKINLSGDILAIQSRIDYESVELKPVLEKAAVSFFVDGIESTINKCKSLNCDAFNFGTVAVRQFGTIEQWERYNWNIHFKSAQISLEVKYTIRRSGSMLKNSEINSVEGEKSVSRMRLSMTWLALFYQS